MLRVPAARLPRRAAPAPAEEAPGEGAADAGTATPEDSAVEEEETLLAEPEKPEAKQLEVGAFSYSSPTVGNGVLYIGNMDFNKSQPGR